MNRYFANPFAHMLSMKVDFPLVIHMHSHLLINLHFNHFDIVFVLLSQFNKLLTMLYSMILVINNYILAILHIPFSSI